MVGCRPGQTGNGVWLFSIFTRKLETPLWPERPSVELSATLEPVPRCVCLWGGGGRKRIREGKGVSQQYPSKGRQSWALLVSRLSELLSPWTWPSQFVGSQPLVLVTLSWSCPAICPPLRALAPPWALLEELAAARQPWALPEWWRVRWASSLSIIRGVC